MRFLAAAEDAIARHDAISKLLQTQTKLIS